MSKLIESCPQPDSSLGGFTACTPTQIAAQNSVDVLVVLRDAAAEGRYERDRMTGHKQAEEWSAEVDEAIAAVTKLIEALDWCVAEINRDTPSVINARTALARVGGAK